MRGLGRIKATLVAIHNRLYATAVIILYHRVTQDISDPQRLAVSADHFDQQMTALKQLSEPVPLNDIPSLLSNRPRSAPLLSAVTFDDGYTDNLTEAAPILRKHQIPATVYVTTATVGHPHELWWDDLDRLLLRNDLPSTLTLRINGTERTWSLQSDSNITPWDVYDRPAHPAHQAYLDLAGIIRELPPAGRNSIMEQLHTWANLPVLPRTDHQTMTEDELRQLTADGLITVGAHTVNHPVLSSLPAPQQKYEITKSKERLEAILERPVTTFSYPYGRIEDYNRATVRAVRNAGFTTCCSNFPGRASRYTDPLQLPRFVAGDWDSTTFEQHFRSWLA